jgi:hypothetical protein
MPYPDLSFADVSSAVVHQVCPVFHICNCFLFPRIMCTRHILILIIPSFCWQNLRPDIPRCCPSAFANVMRKCWDANPDKRPDMDEVVQLLEALDTSKGGGMIPDGQSSGCLCFTKARGP